MLVPESHADRRPGLWVALLAFFYSSLYLLQHIGTPLGQVAVLDGREILAWASALAQGDWPGEPFFRAPLYPLLLAGLLKTGLSAANLMLAAQLVNLLAHTVSAWLVYRIGLRVWRQHAAALVSGGVFALYPLAVFYVGEPLDISLGSTFFLAGLWCVLAGERRPGLWMASSGGLLMALAVAIRPHFLTAAIVLPILPLLLRFSAARLQLAASAFALLIGLLGLGALNTWQSGQFRILPTQGGYNLWAANKPGSNGLYYQQQSNFLSHDVLANPARLESEQLYQADTGIAVDSMDYEVIAAYWRDRAVSSIVEQPGAWLLLELKKLAALLHNTEQYNNKTFAFHKNNSAVLSVNPLGWGVLLVAGFAGLAGAWRRRELQALLLVGSCYAGGVLMFYASARFRFPLVSLLCIGAGGLLPLWQQRQGVSVRRLLPWVLILSALGVFSFFPFQWSKASSTFDEDRLLLARAQAQLGQYQESISVLDEIVSGPHNQPRAWDLLCSARFNSLREHEPEQLPEALPRAIKACQQVADRSTQAEWILAFELWLSGQHRQAVAGWQRIAAARGPEWQRAMACLAMAGELNVGESTMLANLPMELRADLLLLAQSAAGDSVARQELARRYQSQAVESQLQWLLQVFKSKENDTQ